MTDLHAQYGALRARYNNKSNWEVWAKEIARIADHIAIPDKDIASAEKAYEELGDRLAKKLSLTAKDISIYTQGSARSKTLIRPATREDFDLDAVCEIGLSRYHGDSSPMVVFETVGKALIDIPNTKLIAKNRCWRIEYPNERFYIDLTPARPQNELEWRKVLDSKELLETRIEVVDRPTKKWSPSNPRGFVRWFDKISNQRIKFLLLEERARMSKAATLDGIEAVPDQEVPLSDTLRMAVRLFKRHRDIAARNKLIDADNKPISIIISTRVAEIHEAAARSGMVFDNPIQLLLHLAENISVIGRRPHSLGEYWVENPSQEPENFADRWNKHDGARLPRTYQIWANHLASDIAQILTCATIQDARTHLDRAFGTTNAPAGGPGNGGGNPGILGGLAVATPTRAHAAPKTGLA